MSRGQTKTIGVECSHNRRSNQDNISPMQPTKRAKNFRWHPDPSSFEYLLDHFERNRIDSQSKVDMVGENEVDLKECSVSGTVSKCKSQTVAPPFVRTINRSQ